MMSLSAYLILSAGVFGISLVGLMVNKKNMISLLMCIELMLLAVNTNFLAFAQYNNQAVGAVFVFFILAVAAAETALGLAILVLLYRERGTINVTDIKELKG